MRNAIRTLTAANVLMLDVVGAVLV